MTQMTQKSVYFLVVWISSNAPMINPTPVIPLPPERHNIVSPCVPYDEWRGKYCRALQEFIRWRFCRPSLEPPQDEDYRQEKETQQEGKADVDDGGEHDHENLHGDTQPPFSFNVTLRETNHGATNQQTPQTQQTQTVSQDLGPHHQTLPSKRPIPTETDCYCIDDLSLHASRIHLSFCQKYLLWPFHEIQSRHARIQNQRVDVHTTHSKNSLIYPPPTFEDGPLFSVYRHVLSIDLLEHPCTSTRRKNPSSLNVLEDFALQTFQSHSKLPQEYPTRRIRLYFYDAYAYWFHQVVSSVTALKKAFEIYISFENIPFHCVFPSDNVLQQKRYTRSSQPTPAHKENISQTDLLLAEDYGLTSNYSICIGRQSGIRLPLPYTNDYLAFDSESLCIRILFHFPSTNESKEYRLTANWIDSIISYDTTMKTYTTTTPMAWKENGDGKIRTLYSKYKDDTKQHNGSPQRRTTPMNTHQDMAHPSRFHQAMVGPNSNYTATSEIMKLHDLEEALNNQPKRRGSNDTQCFIPKKSIYAIVLGFTAPTLSRSGSYHMHVTLIDPSIPLDYPIQVHDTSETNITPNDPSLPHVSLMLFANHPKSFPNLSRAGDVLCIRDFKIQKFKEEIQLLGQIIERSHDCRYAVCRPSDDVLEQIALNPSSFTLSSEKNGWIIHSKDDIIVNMDIVMDRWKWGFVRLSTKPTIKSTSMYHISELDRLSVYSLDLDVMITDILPAAGNSNGPKGYLRVWDGTGVSISHPLPVSVEKSMNIDDPPCQALVSIQSIIQQLNRLRYEEPQNTNTIALEPPKSLCGCVINVAVWETCHWEMIQFLKNSYMNIGKFVRFRNVLLSTKVETHGCILNLCSKSWLTPLLDTTFEVGALLRNHALRISRKEPYNPTSGLLPLPLTPFDDFLYSNSLYYMKEILPAPSTVTVTFKVLQHTIHPAVDPKIPDALKNLIIFDSDDNVHKYLFSIRISDKTLCLDVLVEDVAAQSIFGISAPDFLATLSEINELTSRCRIASQRLSALWDTSVCYKGSVASFHHSGEKCFCLKFIEV